MLRADHTSAPSQLLIPPALVFRTHVELEANLNSARPAWRANGVFHLGIRPIDLDQVRGQNIDFQFLDFGHVPLQPIVQSNNPPRTQPSAVRPRCEIGSANIGCGGAPVLRARFNLELSPLVPATKHLQSLKPILRRMQFVDLFNSPLPEQNREHVMLRTSQKWIGMAKWTHRIGVLSRSALR